MKKAKRVFCAILCIAIIFSVFAISAYADRGKLRAKAGVGGYLKSSYVAPYYGPDGTKYLYVFPQYSTFKLQQDLYTNDTTAFGTLSDTTTGFRVTDQNVPVSKLYIEVATDSLLPDFS